VSNANSRILAECQEWTVDCIAHSEGSLFPGFNLGSDTAHAWT